MKALHFGAGNIGRGFIGLVLSQNGYQLTFADVNQELIDGLKKDQEYDVIIADGSNQRIHVDGFDAIHSPSEGDRLAQAICEADLITMAVGPRIVPFIAQSCVAGISQRLSQQEVKPLNIIACENAVGATDLFKEALLKELAPDLHKKLNKFIGFPNSAVDRIVPAQHNDNPLDVKVEPFFEWAVEKGKLINHSLMNDVHYVDDLTPYIERKLFTVNTGHAACAYFGLLAGYQNVDQAMSDEKIEQKVRDVLSETSTYILNEYDLFTKEEHQEYVDTIINRFKNPEISDDLLRVARNPLRKVSRSDRFVKPALGLLEKNVIPTHLARAIAAAYRFDNSNDQEAVEIQNYLKDHSLTEALIKFSELKEDSELIKLVEMENKEIV